MRQRLSSRLRLSGRRKDIELYAGHRLSNREACLCDTDCLVVEDCLLDGRILNHTRGIDFLVVKIVYVTKIA